MGHDNKNMAANNKDKQPKKKRGPSPVVISKEFSQWLNDKSYNAKVANWKKGGGRSPWKN